jgi:hypothetical protein
MMLLKKINTAKIKELLLDFKVKILKSEIARIGTAVFFGIVLLLFLVPFLFNNSELKFQIEQSVSQASLASFAINGNVSVRFIPYPCVVIRDVILRNYQPKAKENLDSKKVYNFYAKSVTIKLPLFQTATLHKVKILDPILESYDSLNRPALIDDKFRDGAFPANPDSANRKANSGVSSKIFSIDSSSFEIGNSIDIAVKNGQVAFFDQVGRKQQFNLVNFKGSLSGDKTKIIGDFTSENNKNDFRFITKFNSSSRKPTSILEVTSPLFKMSLKGNFTSQNNGFLLSDFKGKIEAEIADFKTFYKSYISSQSLIYQKLRRNSKAIKISANINNEAGEIAIDDLAINSSAIAGGGNIFLNFARQVPIIDFNLALDNLDLDDIYSDEFVTLKTPELVQNLNEQKQPDVTPKPVEAAKDLTDADATKTEVVASEIVAQETTSTIEEAILVGIKDIDLTADISIKNVKYLEEEISNVDLYLNSSQSGKILILPLAFRTPGQGYVWFSGMFDNDLAIPKFVGKFNAAGEDLNAVVKWLKIESQNLKFDNLAQYRFNCDILYSSTTTAINNLYLNLNKGQTELVGKVTIDSNDKISNLYGRFAVSDFDMNKYFLTSRNNNYLLPGSLIKKMLWLNNINTNHDLSFTFNKLSYNGEDFLDQDVKIKIGRGYFAIDDLRLKAARATLNLGLNIDISQKKPQFELNISSQDFVYNSILKPDNSGSLIDSAIRAIKKEQKINFIDQFYALPSLEGFEGKISLNFTKLKLDNVAIDIAKLSGKIKDGTINIAEMSGGIYGGSFGFKGLIGMKLNKNINGNLSFMNISLKPFLSDIFNITNIDGTANISSSLVSSAYIKQKFTESLNSEIKFVVNSPTVTGYGLSNLVKKMFAPQVYQKELYEPVKILINPKSATTFKDARGTIQINKKDAKLRATLAGNALNSVLSGSADLENNNIDVLLNTIFLTGNRQKQIPINIATSIKGDISNPSSSTNFDQVTQYLGYKSVKLNQATAQ